MSNNKLTMEKETLKPFCKQLICEKGEHKGLPFYSPLQQSVDDPTWIWKNTIFTDDYMNGYCNAILQVRNAISCMETKPELEAVFKYTIHLMKLLNEKKQNTQ
jgi:hypothetical protein